MHEDINISRENDHIGWNNNLMEWSHLSGKTRFICIHLSIFGIVFKKREQDIRVYVNKYEL